MGKDAIWRLFSFNHRKIMREKIDFVVALQENKSVRMTLECSDDKARFSSAEGVWVCEILKSNHNASQDPIIAPFEDYPGLSNEDTQKVLSEVSGRGHLLWLLKGSQCRW